MPSLTNLGYFVLLLGVLVFVHELGHYLVAKACNVKVLKFSIGFGPTLFGFRRGETEYVVAWLPLGGYVKMEGELPNEEIESADTSRSFNAQPPWKRALIVAAGPAANLIFPVIVFFGVYLGPHEVTAAQIGTVEAGMPAAEAGLVPGDRVVSVEGAGVTSFSELSEALQERYGQPTTLTVERNGERLEKRLVPARGIASGPLDEGEPRGEIGIRPWKLPPVVGVPPGSPAEEAGLRTFDRILSVDGRPIPDEVALRRALDGAEGTLEVKVARYLDPALPGVATMVPSVHTVTVDATGGDGYAALGTETSDLYLGHVQPGSAAEKAGLRRGDRLVALDGEPIVSFGRFRIALKQLGEAPFELTWLSDGREVTETVQVAAVEIKDPLGQVTRPVILGVSSWIGPGEALEAETLIQHMGPAEALFTAAEIVPRFAGAIVKALGGLITGSVPVDNLGGPIMLYQLAKRSAEQGWESFLNMMALISINLGIINLVPIPVLDGFGLLAALWEGIRRRPIPVRAREVANMVGLALLIALMVLVFKNDLTR